MSKQIDFDKPLSDEDRQWLHERSQDYLIAENDRKFAKEGEAEVEPEVSEDGGQEFVTTGAKAPWEPGTEPSSQFAQRPYDPPVSGNWDPGPVVSEEDLEGAEAAAEADDDLGTWTVDELREELRAQGESTSGNKDELVKRLRKATK